jgi:hypothetical protein
MATASVSISTVLPIIALAIGAYLQYWVTRASEARRSLITLRTTAYVDYLRCVAESAHKAKNPRSAAGDLYERAADAKTRICVYGEPDVVKILSKFTRNGETTSTPEGEMLFLELCQKMRPKKMNRNSNISIIDLSSILFGR